MKTKMHRAIMTLIYATRVLRRNMKVFYKLYKSNLVINFVEPTIYMFAFGLGLGAYISDINGMKYLNYIAPGMIAYSGLVAAAYECLYSTYTRMVEQKTFDAILATPINAEGVVLGEMLYASVKSVVFSAIVMIVVFIGGLIPSPFIMLLSLPFIFLGAMCLAGMSMVMTSFVKGMETYNYYLTLVISPLMFISGVFFPLTGMLEKIAAFSPFYQTTIICQTLATGRLAPVMPHVLILTAMVIITGAAAIAAMKRRLIK